MDRADLRDRGLNFEVDVDSLEHHMDRYVLPQVFLDAALAGTRLGRGGRGRCCLPTAEKPAVMEISHAVVFTEVWAAMP